MLFFNQLLSKFLTLRVSGCCFAARLVSQRHSLGFGHWPRRHRIFQALKAWSTPREGTASLVPVVNGDIEAFSMSSPDKKLTDAGEWFGGQLVRQYRVPPGEYQFRYPNLAQV